MNSKGSLMKKILYVCTLITIASLHLTQASSDNSILSTNLCELVFETPSTNESVICNDPTCNCSSLLAASTELRAKQSDDILCDNIHAYAKQYVQHHFP